MVPTDPCYRGSSECIMYDLVFMVDVALIIDAGWVCGRVAGICLYNVGRCQFCFLNPNFMH